MSKKNNFVKSGKGEEVYFDVPDEFKAATGIKGLTEEGISIYANGRFDKAYVCRENKEQVSNVEKVKGCTMLLRSSGANFSFYEIPEQEKILLLISLRAKSLAEAEKAFGLLEKDMQGNLYTFGITMLVQNAEEKLALMHHLVMMDVHNAKIDVSNYLAKTSGWLPDFKLQHYAEQEDMLKTKDMNSTVLYVRRVPTEHAAQICQNIRKRKDCRVLVTVYEPVSDQEVLESVKRNYIGYEPILYALNRKKSGIGKIVEGRDERRYVYAGIYFVLSDKDEVLLKQALVDLRTQLRKYGCEIESFQFYQKEKLQRMAVLTPWEMRQTMMLQSGNMVAMNPFYKGNENLAEEDMGTKAELLSVFDSILEGGIGCQ